MALMEEAEPRGQESAAPARKINHRRGAGGKDGRTEEKDGRRQASAGPAHSKVAPARPVHRGAGAGMLLTYYTMVQVVFMNRFTEYKLNDLFCVRFSKNWDIIFNMQRRNEAGINICLFKRVYKII